MNVIDLNKIGGPAIDLNIEVDVTDLDRLKTLVEGVVPPYINNLSTLPNLGQTDTASPWAAPSAGKKSSIHYMVIINDLQLDNERLSALQANFFRQDVRVINALLEQSRADFSKIHDAHYDAVKSQHQWSDWKEYGQYLGFAGAAAAAASGTGVVVVTASALSATIGLGNRIATNAGLWKEIAGWFTSSELLQNKIAQRIDTSLTWTALALGAIGGVGAISQGVAGLNAVTNSLTIANGAMTVSTNLGNAYATKQVEDLNGQKTINSADQSYQKRMIQELSTHIRTNFEQTKSIQEMLQKCND